MTEKEFHRLLLGFILGIILLFVVAPITCTVVLSKKAIDEVNEKGLRSIGEEIWEGK